MTSEQIVGDRTYYISLGDAGVIWTLRCFYDVVHDNRRVRRDVRVKALGGNFEHAIQRARQIVPECAVPPIHESHTSKSASSDLAELEQLKMPFGNHQGHTLAYIRETFPDYHDWLIRTVDTTQYPTRPLSKYIEAFRAKAAASK